jgi:hypothetical protein
MPDTTTEFVASGHDQARSWQDGWTLTLHRPVLVFASVMAAAALWPIGAFLALAFLTRRYTRPYTYIIWGVTALLAVAWFTVHSMDHLGLATRAVR